MKSKLLIAAILICTSASAQYTKLLNFSGLSDGSNPYGSLISDGTFLYGMTLQGGANSDGVIFKIKPNGTGYVDLLDFAGTTNGSQPFGSLIYEGGILYGMTSSGGTKGMGLIFKINPTGIGYDTVLNFSGANGSQPFGSLISDGIFLYGMTNAGGTNNDGVVFKIKLDGTGYIKLLNFSGTNGINPLGSLISDGTFLYGMTSNGGLNSKGLIFKIMLDGTNYTDLLDFAGGNGNHPQGSLISDGTFLYGMTYTGGTNNDGIVFKIMPDGTNYTDLLDFTGTINGSHPFGSLFSDGTFLYGMAKQGGTNDLGTFFKIKPDGTGYAKQFNFKGTNGGYPYGSLVSNGTFLYGMTSQGGTNNVGTVFRYCYIPVTFSQSPTICAGKSLTIGNHLHAISGIYHDTLTTSQGCDSIITTNLTVLPSNTTTQSPTVCPGQSLIIGIHTYSTSGTYYDTLTSYRSCDSTVTTHLTVLSSSGVASSQTLTLCAGHSVMVGTDTYTTTGTYTYHFLGSSCDSSITTNLTVLPANSFTQSPTVCAGHSVTVGAHTYTISATYTDLLTSYQGCDSIVTTNLTVLPANTSTQSPTVCAGHSVTVGTHIYTTSATYTDVLTSYQGCDSTVTTNLTVLPANTSSQSPTVCAGHSVAVGTHIYTTSATYTDVFSAANGCDSVVTTNLTVLPANTFTQSPIVCAGQNVIVGTHKYTTSATYTDVFSAANGCDSVVTTNLTVLPANTFTQSPTVCEGHSIIVGTHTYTTSATYTDVLISLVNSCDSTVTTNLTVLSSSGASSSQTFTKCAGQSVTVGTDTYTTSGTYTYHFLGNSCDSTVTTNLTVLPANTFTQSSTVCAGQSVTVGTHIYTTSATYIDVFPAANGCDSTVTTHLTVLPANTFTQSPTVCAGQSVTVGTHIYTASATYTDVLTSLVNSCDSTVITHLTVIVVDTSVSVSTATLTSHAFPAIYQWINCNNGNASILGQTNQSFTATTNGNYAVIVTQNSCSDTSSCYNITTTGIADNNAETSLKVFPNPNKGEFFIQSTKEGVYSIIDELGQTILAIKLDANNNYKMNIENLSNGIYFIVGYTDNQMSRQKVVINK